MSPAATWGYGAWNWRTWAAASRRSPQLRRRREQPAVLVDGVVVGHAGDVVGDAAGDAGCARSLKPGAPLLGHGAGVGHEAGKEVAQDRIRLLADADDAGMAVHARMQERLDRP